MICHFNGTIIKTRFYKRQPIKYIENQKIEKKNITKKVPKIGQKRETNTTVLI